jgi:hypothetical protein
MKNCKTCRLGSQISEYCEKCYWCKGLEESVECRDEDYECWQREDDE